MHNVGEEGLCHGLGGGRVAKGDEVAVLAEAVDDGENHRLPTDTGQCFNEVEPNVCPDDSGDWQRHEEAGQVEMLRLVPLTCSTCPHKVLHNTTHVGKMEVAAEPMYSALDALMSIIIDSNHNLLQEG